MRSPGEIFAVLAGAACSMLLLRLYADRSERGRVAARRMYNDPAHPQFIRALLPLLPLWAVASFLFGLLAVIPRPLAVWMSIPVLVLAGATFLLSYRVPKTLMSGWLREEIERGSVRPPRPDRLDWALFWIVLPFAILGPIAVLVLILVYGAAGIDYLR